MCPRSGGRRALRLPLFICCLLLGAEASADRVYLEPTAFIEQAFAGAPPPPQVLWLTADLKPAVREILGHDLPMLRLRYWRQAGRSAWILDEIGKERPITVGVVVADGAIERIRVLVFRESRGDEVRHAFFTDQFGGARLTGENRLDRPVDGVSGATLSVRALTAVARLALYLHGQTAGLQ